MFTSIKNLINDLKPAKPLYVAFDSGGYEKPTIILLHGIAATSKTWDFVIKELSTNDYRVIALDMLGFGKSPKPDKCEYNVDDHVRYVHKTLKRLRVKKPYVLVGHSMGSIVSAHYCVRYPEIVERAYLLSLPLYPENIENQKKLPGKLTDIYINAYNLMSDNKAFTIKYSGHLRKLLRLNDGIDINEETWNSFRLSLKNIIINQNTYSEMKDIKIPVHVLYGSLDQFLVQDNVKRLADFQNVKVTKLTALDHSVGSRFSKAVVKQIIDDYEDSL